MEEQRDQQPVLCANGCGFFGNPLTSNYCSKCWKDKQLSKHSQQKTEATPSSPFTNTVEISGDAARVVQPQEKEFPSKEKVETTEKEDAQHQESSVQSGEKEGEKIATAEHVDNSRCYQCRKKVGLLGFKCRCTFYFCPKHRRADQHNCSFDYKTMARKELEEKNPEVKAEKMNKI